MDTCTHLQYLNIDVPLCVVFQLKNPLYYKPPYKFGTIPDGSTDTNIRNNDVNMHNYIKKHYRKTVAEGVEAVKDG